LPTYGVLAAIGLILGLTLNVRLAVRDGIDEEKSWNLGIIAIVAAVLGSKLLLVITNWSYYSANPRALLGIGFLQAGGVYYGGIIAAVLASVVYMKLSRMPMLRTCDAFAPGIAFGHGIGRLGCLAAGCCYGKPTDLPWGITFTDPLAYKLAGTPLHISLHPTQIYEFLVEMVLALFLLAMWKRRTFSGQIIGSYAFLYGVVRFFLEFLRNDPERGSLFGGAITITQLISVIFVIVGGVLWMKGPNSKIVGPAPATT
jgi:phosphatidylglycerol---prolipoprotein diacylglyceryl transferase